MKAWLKRYQELVAWLPLIALLAISGWIFFGSSAIHDDLIRFLLELPILSAYAVAAAGLAYLTWRRWSMRLTEEEVCKFWDRLMAGERGPLIVFGINAVMYACFVTLFVVMLWPAR